jgi:hypothetical protein
VRNRLFTAALTCTLILAGSPSAPGVAVSTTPCDLQRRADETIRHLSKRQIRCAVETFGPVKGGVDRAICIAKRESNLLPGAQNPEGPYDGLFQHLESAWDDRYTRYTEPLWSLPTSPFSGRTNAIVSVLMVVDFGTWNEAGWRRGDC